MNWLNDVLALMKLIPTILTLIVSIQQIFQPAAATGAAPAIAGAVAPSGAGPAKKAIILAALEAGAAPAAVVAKADVFIDKVVPLLKAPFGPIARAL